MRHRREEEQDESVGGDVPHVEDEARDEERPNPRRVLSSPRERDAQREQHRKNSANANETKLIGAGGAYDSGTKDVKSSSVESRLRNAARCYVSHEVGERCGLKVPGGGRNAWSSRAAEEAVRKLV